MPKLLEYSSVILPSLSFVSIAHAVIINGGTPVFVDIEPETMCIDPTHLKKISWKKAINYDGFSDHTLGIIAPIIFSILKKRNNAKKIIIEKHVKLKSSKGPDASSSIDTDELKQLTWHIRNIEKMEF